MVLTPHLDGLSPQASRDTVDMVSQNLLAHFEGRPLLTPLPLPTPNCPIPEATPMLVGRLASVPAWLGKERAGAGAG